MTYLLWLWRWLNSPHCICGNDKQPVCRKHERRHLPGHDSDICICKHLPMCHLLSNTTL